MKKIWRVVFIVFTTLLVLTIGGGICLYTLVQPTNPTTQQQIKFVIPKGQPIIKIANNLKEKKLIKHPLVFRLVVKKQGLENKIQAGSFDLSANMNIWQITKILTQGTNDIWLTIPEGWRREEIAASIAKLDLSDYSKDEFLNLSAGFEGQLFPDSYLIPKMMSTQALFNLLTNTFEKKVASLETEIKQTKNNSLLSKAKIDPDKDFMPILVMASILEREARGFAQMQTVSGVLWNRIAINMFLQVDASLQYIKGFNKTVDDWWVPPLAVDKEIESPFNTYLNVGLPPKPICNPGLDAIKAALTPNETNYLYYLHDRQGKIHFAVSFEEHNNNINKYLR